MPTGEPNKKIRKLSLVSGKRSREARPNRVAAIRSAAVSRPQIASTMPPSLGQTPHRMAISAQSGKERYMQWRPSFHECSRMPKLLARHHRLCRENRLTCPLRGAAYHHVNRAPGITCASESKVVKIKTARSDISRITDRMSWLGSGPCSNTSNAVTSSKYSPAGNGASPMIGSYDMESQPRLRRSSLNAPFPPP